KWQLVKVLNERTGWGGYHVPIVAISDAIDAMPIGADADRINQFHQRRLTFKANNTIESRNQFKSLFVTQTGEVAPHGEVAIDAQRAHGLHQHGIAIDKELKD